MGKEKAGDQGQNDATMARLIEGVSLTARGLQKGDIPAAQFGLSRLRLAAGVLYIDLERKRGQEPDTRLPRVAEVVAQLSHEYRLALKHELLHGAAYWRRTIGDGPMASIFITVVKHDAPIANDERAHRAHVIRTLAQDEDRRAIQAALLRIANRVETTS